MRYLPDIENRGDYEYPSLWVGRHKVGDYYANQDVQDILNQMFADMIRKYLESQGVNFYEEEEEEEEEEEAW